MRRKRVSPYILFLLTLFCCETISAQSVEVTIGKRAGSIPKSCESVVPASIGDPIDVAALVKEAYCKGDGDMLADYTYVMTWDARSVDKKRQTKQASTTYEVFIPILKSGTYGEGVLMVTSRNGVPVPADKLEKAQLEAGKTLEKAEEKNEKEKPTALETAPQVKGMLPLGVYTSTSSHATFGNSRTATLGIQTFLKTCELTFARHEEHEGRDTLIFTFTPRPGAHFTADEKYIARLTGEIWIDAEDHIVTRLIGRPTLSANNAGSARPVTTPAPAAAPTLMDAPPAVYVEMMRLPQGVWLPKILRINGADYNKLFDRITWESTWTYSNFRRFSTEIKEVKINPEGKP
jgi:hypothetical protein